MFIFPLLSGWASIFLFLYILVSSVWCDLVTHGGALRLRITQLINRVIEVFMQWVSSTQRLVDMNSSRVSSIGLEWRNRGKLIHIQCT